MPVTARTWVEGEIGTATKLNTIRDDLLLLDSLAGIKSIQYITITISNGNTTNTGAIATVTTSKTVLHHLGHTAQAGGGVTDALVRISLTSSTQVTATRGNTNADVTVGICVAEYK